jgi:hypothetical protein
VKILSRRLLLAVVLSGPWACPASAQPIVRLPQEGTTVFQPGVYPPAGATSTLPPSSLGVPAFDPYAQSPGLGSMPSVFDTPPPLYGTPLPPGATAPPGGLYSYPGQPGGLTSPQGSAVPYSQPYGTYPPGGFPSGAPPSLFPEGMGTTDWGLPAVRFLTPRVRYTYVHDRGSETDLGIHDFDSSVAAAFPNFLFSTQPLYVIPSFSLHLWSGPRAPARDLPANAYSAFLDFGWSSDPVRPIGGEVGVRVGLFTDFDTLTTDSGRIMGQGLFRVQTTPTTTLRGGVVYINRNDLKLLPAFGLLWTPNSQTRFDIFFPRPKLSQHLTTLGNQDIWWYLGGEYGGGAWTVRREAGFSDRIDINDIRVVLGLEWGQSALLQQGRRTGFFEAGWVTAREVVYVTTPDDSLKLRDSFMLRIGWNY